MFLLKPAIDAVSRCVAKRQPILHKAIAEHRQNFSDQIGNDEDVRCTILLQVVQQLATTQRVKERDAFKRNALHIACLHNAPLEVIEYLVELYPDAVTEQDKVGRLPVHNACSNQGCLEVIQYLVEEYPESVIETTDRGSTPLLCACESSSEIDVRVIAFLIDQDPEAVLLSTHNDILHMNQSISGNNSVSLSQKARHQLHNVDAKADGTDNLSVSGSASGHDPVFVDDHGTAVSSKMDGSNYNRFSKNKLQQNQKQQASQQDVAPLQSSQQSLTPSVATHSTASSTMALLDNTVTYKLGKTPLHAACSRNASLDIVELLIRSNPRSIKNKDSWGRTPFYCACTNPSVTLDVIDLLLSVWDGLIQEGNRVGQLPLHALCASGMTPENNIDCLSVLEALMDAFPAAIKHQDNNGRLPLHAAVSTGTASVEVLEMLINTYPDAVTIVDRYGNLPIHIAVQRRNSIDVIRYLIDLNPVSVRTKEWRWHRVPFQVACAAGNNLAILEYLFELFPKAVQLVDKENNNALHLACSAHSLDTNVVLFLLEHCPEDCCESVTLDSGSTCLHLACANKANITILYLLHERNKEAIKTKDKKGRLPLHRAFMVKTDLPTLSRLNQLYPRALTTKDNSSFVPTDYATDDDYKKFLRAKTSYNLRKAYCPSWCIKDIDEEDENEDDDLSMSKPQQEGDSLIKDNGVSSDNHQTNTLHHRVDSGYSRNKSKVNHHDQVVIHSLNPDTGRSQRKLV